MDWLWYHVAEKDKQGTRIWSFDDVIGARKGVARLQLNLVTNHCRGFFLGSAPLNSSTIMAKNIKTQETKDRYIYMNFFFFSQKDRNGRLCRRLNPHHSEMVPGQEPNSVLA